MSDDPETQLEPVAEVQGGNPLDVPTEQFSGALQRRGDNRKALIQWVRESLVEGVDFGKIKIKGRESKPTLWKPGAEKICGMLGVTATFPRMQDYEQSALEGREIQSIIMRCHLVDGHGRIVADGLGARSLAQDNGDLNKALKMACKSSHIDATLRMAGLSEVFTQDVEDMIKEKKIEGEAQEPESQELPETIDDDQVLHLKALIEDTDTDEGAFLSWLSSQIGADIHAVGQIPVHRYEYARNALMTKAKKMQKELSVPGPGEVEG